MSKKLFVLLFSFMQFCNFYVDAAETKKRQTKTEKNKVKTEKGAEADTFDFERSPAQESSRPTLTYDLGFSTGNVAGDNYSEAHLGFNYFANDWLIWRNAIFARFDEETDYGVDTSLRAYYVGGGDAFGAHFFGGPGYRIASSDLSTLFADAGVIFKIGSLSIGGGYKHFFYSLKNSANSDYGQYFLILSGGGVL